MILEQDDSKGPLLKKIDPLNPTKFRLPPFVNPNSSTNRKTETIKNSPFDLIDV